MVEANTAHRITQPYLGLCLCCISIAITYCPSIKRRKFELCITYGTTI